MPPSTLPAGEPVPDDGALPPEALAECGERPFGFYVHVPFCTVRCGYCDFNTYTLEELGGAGAAPGASRASYAEAAIAEVRRARAVLGARELPVSTVFFGGAPRPCCRRRTWPPWSRRSTRSSAWPRVRR